MPQESVHGRKHIAVIRSRSQHEPVEPERIADGLGLIAPGQIVYPHLFAPGFQLFRQQQRGLSGVAVNGRVCYDHAFFLRRIAGPGLIQGKIRRQIAGQHRAMKRADGLNIQRRGLFQQRLHRHAEFAYDADVIPPGFVRPGFIHIQRAEFAKPIRGKEHLVRRIIGDHHLGPMHHGRHHKLQRMRAQAQRGIFGGHHAPRRFIPAIKLAHHRKRLSRCHHLRGGICVQKTGNIGRMIRLHMLHDQIIRLPPIQYGGQVLHPFIAEPCVHGVHNRNLFIHNHIRIVCHPMGHGILALK